MAGEDGKIPENILKVGRHYFNFVAASHWARFLVLFCVAMWADQDFKSII